MKTKLIAKSIILASTISLSALAGFGAGNGGGVQFCEQPLENQLRYEVYDLKEIKDHIINSRRRAMVRHDGVTSKATYFHSAIAKVKSLSPALAEEILEAHSIYEKNVEDSGNYKLEEVRDVEKFSIDKNCEYRQVINWIDADQMKEIFGVSQMKILRNNDIYDQLDPLNQAAIDFHEALYAVQRQYNDNVPSSSFVRLLTGQAFTIGPIDNDLESLILGGPTENKRINKRTFSMPANCHQKATYTLKNIGYSSIEKYEYAVMLPDWSGGKVSWHSLEPGEETRINPPKEDEENSALRLWFLPPNKDITALVKIKACEKEQSYKINRVNSYKLKIQIINNNY